MNVRRVPAFFSLALVFVAGGAAARLVVQHHPSNLATDFAQPLVVVTAWHAYGTACFAVLAVTIACAACVTVGMALRLQPPRHPVRDVALAAAVALGAAWSWPFVFSSDVYAYAAYGAMAAHGVDPYRLVPLQLHGPFIDAARWQWSGPYPVCVYGPAFVVLARGAFAALGGFGVGPTLWALRGLAGVAFIASIAALGAALVERPLRQRWALLCGYGLNPVAIWSVAEGHNDAFVLLAIFGGAALIRRGAFWTGAGLAGLSAAAKATGVPLALGLALDALVFAPAGRARRIALGVVISLGIATAVALPPLLPALAALRSGGRYAPAASLQGLLGVVPVLALACAALTYGGLRLARRGRDGFAWLGIAVWLALPNAYPWYALWILPAVLAARNGFAAGALWGATIFSVVRYLPDAVGNARGDGGAIAAVATAAPLLLAMLALRPIAPIRKKATSS